MDMFKPNVRRQSAEGKWVVPKFSREEPVRGRGEIGVVEKSSSNMAPTGRASTRMFLLLAVLAFSAGMVR